MITGVVSQWWEVLQYSYFISAYCFIGRKSKARYGDTLHLTPKRFIRILFFFFSPHPRPDLDAHTYTHTVVRINYNYSDTRIFVGRNNCVIKNCFCKPVTNQNVVLHCVNEISWSNSNLVLIVIITCYWYYLGVYVDWSAQISFRANGSTKYCYNLAILCKLYV